MKKRVITNAKGNQRICPFCVAWDEAYELRRDEIEHARCTKDPDKITRCEDCNRKQYFGNGHIFNPRNGRFFWVGPHKLYRSSSDGRILCVDCADIFDEIMNWDDVPRFMLIDRDEDSDEEHTRYKNYRRGIYGDSDDY